MSPGSAPVTAAATSTDSYLPASGNGGYRVQRYDLELDYRPGPARLAGRAVLGAVSGPAVLGGFALDLGPLRVARVL
ncbi:MAG TPA: M1 family peptidase, partial [Pseudonocardiaceae bacterium]